jgi:hypothetical protein
MNLRISIFRHDDSTDDVGGSEAHPNLRTLTKMLMFFAFLILISGCMISHDKHISRVELKDECDFGQDALFHNSPYYLSDEKKDAPMASLAGLFGNHDKSVALVRLVKDGNRLWARFYDAANTEIIYDRLFLGKEYNSDGKRFIIDKWSSCNSRDSIAIGCTWSHIELSCTRDDNLAVKEVDGGGGVLILVIPMIGSSSYLALYQRIPGTKNH